MPKSDNSDVATSVKFVNKSGTPAEIFWFGFDGEPKSYGVIPPGGRKEMETYVTHPWCAKEKSSGKDLLLKRKDVFWPRKTKRRRNVRIRRPGVPKHDDSSSSSDSEDSGNEGGRKKKHHHHHHHHHHKGSGSDGSGDEGKKHHHHHKGSGSDDSGDEGKRKKHHNKKGKGKKISISCSVL